MFAARMTDPTMHGGAILHGEPTVLIGGLPAARVGDPHYCPINMPPLPVHVGGFIAVGSANVVIGGSFAARQFDLCACAEVPFSLPKTSAPAGPLEIGGAEGELSDVDGDGSADRVKWDAYGLEHVADEWELWGFFRHKETNRIGHTKGDAMLYGEHGQIVVDAKGEVAAVKNVSQYDIGGDPANPLYRYESEDIAGGADAHLEGVMGRDERGRYGVLLGAGAAAYTAKGTRRVTADAALNPLLAPVALAAREYLGINAEVTVGASASHGPGGEVLAGSFYDSETGRVHILAKAATVVGLEGEISFGVMEGRSFGDGLWGDPPADPETVKLLLELALAYYGAHKAAAIPNSIAMGCPTVIIGG